MGADLLLTYVQVPVFDDGDTARTSDPHVKSVLEDRIARIVQEDLDFLADQFGYWADEEDEDINTLVKDRLVAALDVLSGDYRRDVEEFVFHDKNGDPQIYLFTGGMSHGDDPTDAWDDVSGLAASGITTEPIPRLMQVS